MCTAIVGIGPGPALLLCGFRDEFAGRAWRPPGRHWPEYRELTGGLDLVAGGTWLALASGAARVACVLNGRGRMAPASSRRSRGILPLQAAAQGKLPQNGMTGFDPFHLLTAEPGQASLATWDGERLSERELPAGLHMIVNSGLATDLLAAAGPRPAEPHSVGREHEMARIAHFLPRLQATARPQPRPGVPVAQAWGDWLPLLNGDGLPAGDLRALIIRRALGDGRIWGTTSISLIALSGHGVRYDFTGKPGDPAAWQPVCLETCGNVP